MAGLLGRLKKIKVDSALVLLLLLFLPLFAFLLYTHMVRAEPDGLYSGGSTWADLALHLAYLTSFSQRGLITILDNPIYSGHKMSYPFLPDFISGVLYRFLPLNISLILPTLFALVVTLVLFYKLALAITGKRFSGVLAPILFFFNGSILGVYYFFKDARLAGGALKYVASMDKEYAHLGDVNLRFSNVICDYILPQRTFVFGLALGIAAIYCLWCYWQNGDKRHLTHALFWCASTPLFHTHTFVTLCFVTFGVFLLDIKNFRVWIKPALIFLVLVAPQAVLLYQPSLNSFLQISPGWMVDKENVFVFWIRNLGVFLPFAIAAVCYATRKQRLFFLPFLLIFVLANVIQFQPHIYDNMKLMLWPFLLACIFLSRMLLRFTRVASVVCVCLLTVTGVLSVYREATLNWRMFNTEDVALAKFVIHGTPPDALFLTSDRHNNPINCLAGRKIYLGYRGWLWTHGIDYSLREQVYARIYRGGSDALSSVRKENIDYILLEKSKYKELNVLESFFTTNFTVVYVSPEFLLLRT